VASKAILPYWDKLQNAELNLINLLNFMGIKNIILDLKSQAKLTKYFSIGFRCMIISGNSLVKLFEKAQYNEELLFFLLNRLNFMLVYSLYPSEFHNNAINFLTSGSFTSLSSFDSDNYQYKITDKARYICNQLSGFSFGPIDKNNDFKFNITEPESALLNRIIFINNQPFFALLKKGRCQIFLVANKTIKNINDPISYSWSIKKYFSSLVPTIIFLRYAFGDACWHNKQNYANFIIDDPVLKNKYGFLDYKKLLAVEDHCNTSTTIAFIPWNYKRTRSETANLFMQRPDRFSLSVHGCDHTKSEFASINPAELNKKIMIATFRMKAHEKMHRVPYDKVMIFPQGIFTTGSMKMLKSNNYLAAVNTTPFPVDGKAENLKIYDFLDIAVTKYHNFPLFVRRYPGELFDFAFDLFIGKPCFIVEHHGYFKDGYEKFTSFINQINELSKNIQWKGLGEIIQHTTLFKTSDDGSIYCKIFGNEAVIRNDSDFTQRYKIFKKESKCVPIAKIMINNKAIKYKINDSKIILSFQIKPKTYVVIRVLYKNNFPLINSQNKPIYFIRAASRRYLSEFRDNYIFKNKLLFELYNKFKVARII